SLLAPRRADEGLSCASPFFGPAQLTFLLDRPHDQDRLAVTVHWNVFWLACYLGASVILFAAVMATFDRFMGRIASRRRRRPPWDERSQSFESNILTSKPWRPSLS